jgi:hypothetical protein
MKFMALHSAVPLAVTSILLLNVGGKACAQSAAWLNAHHWNNPPRSEGLLEEQNARLEYEVRGFEGFSDPNPIETPRDPGPALRIGYCRSTTIDRDDSKNGTAFIEVRPKKSDLDGNYMMKAQQDPSGGSAHPGWNTFSWPTKDVIQKNDIDSNDLSVVIHIGEDNEFAEKIEPAVFTTISSEQAPQVAPSHIDGYVLYLLIQRDALKSLSYTYRSGTGARKFCYYLGEHQPCASQEPSEPPMIEVGTVVKLRLDMSGMPDGDASVQVRGTYALAGDTLNATFHFVHVHTCR